MASHSRSSSVGTYIVDSGQDLCPRETQDVEKSIETPTQGSIADKPQVDVASRRPPTSLQKWLTFVCACMVFLNTWGLVLSFGVFQTYYENFLLPNRSSSDISWISTFCAWISVFAGVVTGPLFDRGYLRSLIACGTLLEVFGIMMMSLSTEYYQLFLSQGLCVGIAMALLYVPSLSAVAAIFDNSVRPVVIGAVASFTGLGGVIYPIMVQRLLGPLGFAWTVRIIGFFILGTYVFAWGVLFYPSRPARVLRPWFDMTILKDTPCVLALIGGFLYGMAYYLPLLYVPAFAQVSILSESQMDLAFYLIAIINAVSFVGRICAGWVASKVGPLETTTFSFLTSSIVLFCWAGVSSTVGLIVWTIFWGVTSSIVVATLGSVVPVLSPDLNVIGTRTGLFWAAVGTGLLVGGPIGGALVDEKSPDPKWWHVEIAAGFFMLGAAVLFVYPLVHVRRKRRAASRLPKV